jgi:hypothetical protein
MAMTPGQKAAVVVVGYAAFRILKNAFLVCKKALTPLP